MKRGNGLVLFFLVWLSYKTVGQDLAPFNEKIENHWSKPELWFLVCLVVDQLEFTINIDMPGIVTKKNALTQRKNRENIPKKWYSTACACLAEKVVNFWKVKPLLLRSKIFNENANESPLCRPIAGITYF